jgi:hypothetical protein
MLSCAIRTRFAPPEFPNIWSSLPPRSNYAPVLHRSPFGRCQPSKSGSFDKAPSRRNCVPTPAEIVGEVIACWEVIALLGGYRFAGRLSLCCEMPAICKQDGVGLSPRPGRPLDCASHAPLLHPKRSSSVAAKDKHNRLRGESSAGQAFAWIGQSSRSWFASSAQRARSLHTLASAWTRQSSNV